MTRFVSLGFNGFYVKPLTKNKIVLPEEKKGHNHTEK